MSNTKRFNPFPGLRPYGKEEHKLFFGRKTQIDEVISKLEKFRFVSVVGNSGSGKSSLIRAGVLPKFIYGDGLFNKHWYISTMRPGNDAIKNLAICLSKLKKDNNSFPDKKELEELFHNNTFGLVQFTRKYVKPDEGILLLIDQFEEIFRYRNSLKDAEDFVAMLIESISQKNIPIYIIITLRSDFIGDCSLFYGLPEAINNGQYLVPRMRDYELQEAINGPVLEGNGKISPLLVTRLQKDLNNNSDQLPVLQHALMRAWEAWEPDADRGNPIDISHYEKIGCMDKALSLHADEAYNELRTERSKKIAELLFRCITEISGDSRGTRRPTKLKDISEIISAEKNEIIEIIEVFRKPGRAFITPSFPQPLDDESIIDISHESLMRVWGRLEHWAEEETQSVQLYNRLSESTVLYENKKGGLWRNPELQVAEEWLAANKPNEAWAKRYNELFQRCMTFLNTSIDDRRKEIKEKRRNTLIIRSITIFIFSIMTVLTFWALSERKNADSNAELAYSQKELAQKQKNIAEEEKLNAEKNFNLAEQQKQEAEKQFNEAKKQRAIALEKAQESEFQKQKAEFERSNAFKSQTAADRERKLAILQKHIADSLRRNAEVSEENVLRLHMLSVAKNIAIQSLQIQKELSDADLKGLLALQAYNFEKKYNGNVYDPDVFTAMQAALRMKREKNYNVFTGHSDEVKTVQFSNDDKNILTTGSEGKIFISPIDNLNAANALNLFHKTSIEQATYSSNGKNILIAGEDFSVILFSANGNATEKKLYSHKQKVTGLLATENEIISASTDGDIYVLRNGNTSPIIFSTGEKILCICYSSQNIFFGTDNGKIMSLNYNEISAKPRLLYNIAAKVSAIEININGKILAAGTSSGILYLFDLVHPNSDSEKILAHKTGISSLSFCNANNFIATSSYDATVKIFQTDNTEAVPLVFEEHDSWVWKCEFNHKGTLLASAGRDKTAIIYIVNAEMLAIELSKVLTRNFTAKEWKKYIGNDIDFEKTR